MKEYQKELLKGRLVLRSETEIHIGDYPAICDFCGEPAEYDGKTRSGYWAYMCVPCFQQHGIAFKQGLGLGKGQRLIRGEA